MTIIHRLGQNIIKKTHTDSYELMLDDNLLNSLNINLFSNSDINSNTLSFKARSVQTLIQYLSHHKKMKYDVGLKMLQDLGNQLVNLEKKGKTIIFYSLDDIIVINEDLFVFLNSTKLFEIDDEKIYWNVPLSLKNGFLPPEMENKSQLPIELTDKTAYYSLSSLLVYCLLRENVKEDTLNEVLKPIIYTNLYWFLKRCIKKNPEKRSFIFI